MNGLVRLLARRMNPTCLVVPTRLLSSFCFCHDSDTSTLAYPMRGRSAFPLSAVRFGKQDRLLRLFWPIPYVDLLSMISIHELQCVYLCRKGLHTATRKLLSINLIPINQSTNEGPLLFHAKIYITELNMRRGLRPASPGHAWQSHGEEQVAPMADHHQPADPREAKEHDQPQARIHVKSAIDCDGCHTPL